MYRKPTPQEEIDAWHRLAWQLDFARKVSMDQQAVIAVLDRMGRWVGAHSDHNGERPEREVEKNVQEAFWKHIAQKEPSAQPRRGRPPKNES